MARTKNTAGRSPGSPKIESVRHKDKRTNIPTQELRGFVEKDEHAPKTVLYPRDPSLDPQLVWKGKPLEVPAVPIYIQERIHPQAIIEDFRRNAPLAPRGRGAGGEGSAVEEQLSLFADFNGLDAELTRKWSSTTTSRTGRIA